MSFAFRILGSSSALPTSIRFPSAYVVQMHERIFLIDCGEGAQIQLRRYKIKLGRLNHILISHIHGDHTFGLFGLLSSFNLIGREHDLHIYCPPDLESILETHFEMFNIQLNYSLVYHHMNCKQSSIIFEDEKIIVDSFPVKHRIPTCGFLFREKPLPRSLRKDMIENYDIPIKNRPEIKMGADFITRSGEKISNEILTTDPPAPRSLAYCTDTLYHRGLVTKIRGVNLLFHESTFIEDEASRAKETYHSTARQAAMIAREAKVKQLVLGHFSARYKDLNPLLSEAREVFSETELAEDGKIFMIEH